MFKRISLAVAILIVLLSSFNSCSTNTVVEAVNVGFLERPNTLNPVLPMNNTARLTTDLIFDGLFNFGVNENNQEIIVPALAESIVQKSDRRTYTIFLRDAQWHDGRKLSAEDIVFSYQAYIEPANDSSKGIYLMNIIEGLRMVNPKTVEITFVKPVSPDDAERILTFKIIPAFYAGAALSPNMKLGQRERDFTVRPVGTGPFRYERETKKQSIILSSFDNYFIAGFPKSPAFHIIPYDDPDILIKDFLKGRVHVVFNLSPVDYIFIEEAIKKESPGKNVEYADYWPLSYYAIALNTQSPLLSNPKVRRQLARIVERDSLFPGLTDKPEIAMMNQGPFPSNTIELNYPGNPRGYHFTDLNSLLDSACPEDLVGPDMPHEIKIVYPQEMGELGDTICKNLMVQLALEGISLTVESRPVNPYRNLVFRDRQYEMALVYYDGFSRTYSDIERYYDPESPDNITGLKDMTIQNRMTEWKNTTQLFQWIKRTIALHDSLLIESPYIYLFTIVKRCYYSGIGGVSIASDNLFASAEEWFIKNR